MALMTSTLIVALGLIIALALGWNSPRPVRSPDWQASGLPVRLETASGETVASLLEPADGNFTLELEAIPLSGPDQGLNGYGLVYRAQSSADYYAFAVGSDGYYTVLRVTGGKEVALVDWQQFPHVRRGQQVNRLRVACAGPICHLYVNDEYATTVEDDTWLTGDIGLWVRSFGDAGAVVQFVNASVWMER
jgi:hypothetical protein